MNKYKTTLFAIGLSFALTACDKTPEKNQDQSINMAGYSAQYESETTYGFNQDDMIIGDSSAPIEIIEYSALTCSHCRHFHKDIFPKLAKKYIDSGKVKVIFRSFLLNPFDVIPTSISRCVPKNKYFAYMGELFEQQDYWFNQEDYVAEAKASGTDASNMGFSNFSRKRINEIVTKLGLDHEKLTECAEKSETMEYNLKIIKDGVDKYKINSTPSLVLNGKIIEFDSFEMLAEEIDKHL